jgi:hypothetical protein
VPEPINNDITGLVPYLRGRVLRVMAAMWDRGFDPMIYESRRTHERQRELYGKGRTAAQCKKAGVATKYAAPDETIVTYTLDSFHIKGKGADIVSRSMHWNWPEFFVALKEEAAKEGLKTLGFEGCHIEWRG